MMNDTEKQLLATSRYVLNVCNLLCSEFLPGLSEMPALKAELERLSNRSREFEHGTFITLIVGPAKSGKSTLVNLIAGAYVSPTNFLECTVRPSVISRRDEGTESSLTCFYTSDASHKVEQIDSIIDSIRGFYDISSMPGVTEEVLPLTPETIKEKVELSLEESLDSQTLLTSIRTPGGRLLQDRVFLIDMPGFDGAYQNIDNPVYEAIARRADLIIFVQSSNAAFSKVSKEFLNLLAERNASVPVCLIHNVFDAAWWRSDKEKIDAVKSQQDAAYKEIRRLGFGIERDDCFCINLGQVRDYREGNYPDVPQLADSAHHFEEIETTLFQRIITKRDTLRLINCLKRVRQQRDRLINDVQKEIATRTELLNKWKEIAESLRSLKDFEPVGVPVLQSNTSLAASIASFECREKRAMISDGTRRNTRETKELLDSLISSLDGALRASTNDIFVVRPVENLMFAEYKQRLADLSHKFSQYQGYIAPTAVAERTLTDLPEFNLAGEIDMDTLIPRRRSFLGMGGTHDASELREYIQSVEEILVTSPDHLGNARNNGRLIRTVLPRLEAEIRSGLGHIAEYYNSQLRTFVDNNETAIKAAILKDKSKFERELSGLESLLSKLESFTFKVE